MKPAIEWLNEIGETVMSAAFSERQPPGTEVEALVKRIQADALSHAADIANKHRQELFEDGLEVDLGDMDKKSIFLESMVQERDSIEDSIRAEAISLTQEPHDDHT